jgi:diketogulonate reductase-like aldo/keto reductase
MLKVEKISKIGIGTWGIGGLVERDLKNDDQKQIDALVHSFNKGINFIEVNNWYAEGYSMELIKKAIDKSNTKRENIFIMYSVYGHSLNNTDDFEKEIQKFLDIFETDYIDSLEFLQADFKKIGYDNLIKIFRKYLKNNRTRYISVANASLEFIKKCYMEFGGKLFSNETHYSFEIRESKKLGIIDYGIEKNIKNIIFQPLRRNNTAKRNWPLLVELSKKYQKTQNQIILSWLVSKKLLPIIKSENIKHIDKNLDALNFKLEQNDIKLLDNFKVKNYQEVILDWFNENMPNSTTISQLPNNFDELYPKNNKQ